MCFFDVLRDLWRSIFRRAEDEDWSYCPSVAVMIVGLNEGDTIKHALESVYDTYPRMELFVVDDGSSDDMAYQANLFAQNHRGVTILSRKLRGGKSSAMNMPLPMITSEIVVVIDSDSHLAEGAIWRIVQPFKDPMVAAVSGSVSARNPFVNLCTWLQALEYRRSIFVGRILLSRLGILGIVSGALGAFRKTTLDKFGGWDVGPGEDGDLTIKFRKAGYKIGYVPEASCLTNVPTNFKVLTKQRRRWEWAAVTFECRKHIDAGNPFGKHFRLDNFFMMLERWIFNVILVYVSVIYWIYLLLFFEPRLIMYLLMTFYSLYVVADLIQTAIVIYYSSDKKRDLLMGIGSPLMPIYYFYQKIVTLIAITEEIFSRRSFRDNFVPERVRNATWHW
jgi:cellulose synthase/poly-beta-1,6-N-acetylglucosamine synthase-like glycosyltransferase